MTATPVFERVGLANALQQRLTHAGLVSGPLYCAEVGARKPPSGEMSREPFYRLANRRILAFEADPDEAARLMRQLDPAAGIEVVDAALGDRDGEAPLHITRNPSCSSLYRPNDVLLDRYPSLEVVRLSRTVPVKLARLDTVCTARQWPRIDFVKMDVQGAELDIVRGGASALSDLTAAVSEISFQPIYHDQPLFGDVAAALAERGLEFYQFIHLGGRSRTKTRNDQMQVLWGDALFLRSPEQSSAEQAARAAIFAALYGAFDFAEASLRRADESVAEWFTSAIKPRPDTAIQRASRFARRGISGVRRRVKAALAGRT